jgi:hypothetical protein
VGVSLQLFSDIFSQVMPPSPPPGGAIPSRPITVVAPSRQGALFAQHHPIVEARAGTLRAHVPIVSQFLPVNQFEQIPGTLSILHKTCFTGFNDI